MSDENRPEQEPLLVRAGMILRHRITGRIVRVISADGLQADIGCAEVPPPKEAPHGWLSMPQLFREFLPYGINGMPLDRWEPK